jgi:hypothetical protein
MHEDPDGLRQDASSESSIFMNLGHLTNRPDCAQAAGISD